MAETLEDHLGGRKDAPAPTRMSVLLDLIDDRAARVVGAERQHLRREVLDGAEETLWNRLATRLDGAVREYLSGFPGKDPSHVVIEQETGSLCCTGCGHKEPFPLGMTVSMTVAALQAYTRDHADCNDPEAPS